MLLSCNGSFQLEPPPRTEDDRAALLIVRSSDSSPLVVAFDLEQPVLFETPSIEVPGSMVWLQYPRSLQAMRIAPGPQELLGPTVLGGREIPGDFRAAFLSQVGVNGAESWRAPEDLEALLEGIRMPTPGPARCAAGGGCYASFEDANVDVCQAPCPAQTVAQPMTRTPPRGAEALPSFPERVECVGADVQWHDRASCEPLSACGSGTWADPLPMVAGVIWYVDARAPRRGDGSQAAPFATLQEALSAATPDDLIALSAGTFSAPVSLPSAHIVGLCASQTRISGSLELAPSASSKLSGLTFEGATLATGQTLRFDRAISEGDIAATDAIISGETVLIEGGLSAAGGSISLERAVLKNSNQRAVDTQNTTTELAGVVIRNTGLGAVSLAGGAAQLSQVLIMDSPGYALTATRAAELVAADLSIESIVTECPSGAIYIGANARLERVRIDDVLGTAIYVETGSMELADARISGVKNIGNCGHGVVVDPKAQGAMMERVELLEIDGVGIASDSTPVIVEDLVLRSTGQGPDREYFRGGILMQGTAELTGERILLEEIKGSQGIMGTVSSKLFLSSLAMQSLRTDTALELRDDARAEISRIHVSDAPSIGIRLANFSVARIDDLEFFDSASNGEGIITRDFAMLFLTRAHLESVQGVSLCLRDFSEVDAQDLRIEGTRAGRAICPSGVPSSGMGIAVDSRAKVKLHDFVLSGNASHGALFNALTDIEVRDGEVSNNPVGVLLSDEQDSFAPLLIRVRYLNNVQDFGREL